MHTSTPPAITARHFQIHDRTFQVESESQNVKKSSILSLDGSSLKISQALRQPHKPLKNQECKELQKHIHSTITTHMIIIPATMTQPQPSAAASARSAHCDSRAPMRSAAARAPAPARRAAAPRGGTRPPRWRQPSCGRPPRVSGCWFLQLRGADIRLLGLHSMFQFRHHGCIILGPFDRYDKGDSIIKAQAVWPSAASMNSSSAVSLDVLPVASYLARALLSDSTSPRPWQRGFHGENRKRLKPSTAWHQNSRMAGLK